MNNITVGRYVTVQGRESHRNWLEINFQTNVNMRIINGINRLLYAAKRKSQMIV